MKKFEVGKSYRNTFAGSVITVTKRTAQFISYIENGVDVTRVTRSKISVYSDDGECITTPAKYVYFAANEVSDEPAPETEPAAAQEAANEPEADATELNMKTYKVSFVVDGICQGNMAIAENAKDVEAYYNREYNGRGEVFAVREAAEWEIEEDRRRGMPFVKVPAAKPEEPETVDEAANASENATAAMTAQEVTARKLYVRAHELRNRAEGLNYEGKLDDGFVRSIERLEVAAYRAAAHESAVRLASKNPRVAAAMERLRAKQAAPNDKPQACERKPAFEAGRVYRNEAQEAGKDTIEVTARSGCVVTFVWNGQEMTADVRFDDPDSEYILIGLKPFFASELETGEEPAAGQPAPQGDMTDEERIDALFAELVPVEGKANTVAGEIVRAVCRIGHRYNNDGDYVGSGYGKETCNPAARYLMANAGENVAEIVRCLWKAGEECGVLDDGSYDGWLSELVKATLAYLDEHPELKTTPNAEDYWNYRDPVEDIDEWDDDSEVEWDAA